MAILPEGESMAFSKEVLDEILMNYHDPDDFYGAHTELGGCP
jgi:hypothetical protein